MAVYQVLGLFEEVTPAGDAIEALRKIGVSDRKITVLSGFPYAPKMLGRKHTHSRLLPIALTGALIGFMAALFLTFIMPQLYPIVVGGRPIVNLPPSLIIIFELTVLGVIVATFIGFLVEGGFPNFGPKLYDKRIAEGYVGVQAEVNDPVLLERTVKALTDHGAQHLQQAEVARYRDPRLALLIGLLVVAGIAGGLVLLFAYDVIPLPFLPDQMKESLALAPLQGPRIPPPEGAVPVQGLAVIGNQPATAPLPPTEDSIQRGEVLFSLHCSACHLLDGDGTTVVGGKFPLPPPAMTSARVAQLTAEQLFVVITNGRGLMLPLAENLYPEERWDVVNYVQSLSQ